MTPEEKAKISRENGSKSKGPVTAEGKEKSARNGITHGLRTEKLKHFIPPHHAVLCNEERAEYYQLLDELLAVYQPGNPVALSVVRDIAVARWQILRLDTLITTQWNLTLAAKAQEPITVAPELGELAAMSRTAEALHTGHAILRQLNSQIDKFNVRIARLERRLKFVHTNFPSTINGRTQPPPPQSVEKTEKTPANTPKNEQPVFITENTPEVIAFYKQNYPGRQIIVQPADDVANGIDTDDDMPDIPRKAA